MEREIWFGSRTCALSLPSDLALALLLDSLALALLRSSISERVMRSPAVFVASLLGLLLASLLGSRLIELGSPCEPRVGTRCVGTRFRWSVRSGSRSVAHLHLVLAFGLGGLDGLAAVLGPAAGLVLLVCRVRDHHPRMRLVL